MSSTSTPASISAAATRWVCGVGVLVHEFAGVGDQADVEGRGHLRGDRRPEADGEVVDDLGRAGGVDVDQVEVAEAGVVVVVVDVDDVVAAVGEEVDRHAVDVAAVEEDDGAVGHVGRRLVEDLLQRQEAVLDRQRELLRGEEHHRVLAELGQQLVHAQQRAERVAVGALVGGQQEAVAGAQLGADPLEVGCGDAGGLAHASGSGSGLAGFLVEQLRDPHALLDRVVVVEGQGRGPLHPRLGGDPGLDHAVGGAQADQRRLAFLLAAEHADVHLGGAQVGAGVNRGHGHEADAGVAQIVGDRGADDLAQHLVDAPHARAGHPYSRVCSTCLVWKNSSTSSSLTSA